jgi:hypothetical protein
MEQIIPASNTTPSAEEQFANNLAQNQALQAEIKNAIIIKLMSNNPKLAKAIAYRSTHPHLFSSEDFMVFYDHYNSYKQELVQNAVAALESLSDRIFEKIKQDQTDLIGHGITQAKVNSVTADCGNNGCSVILNVTLTYTNGTTQTGNMSLGDIISWF